MKKTDILWNLIKMNKNTSNIINVCSEECAEVIQAISKIFRFGMETSWNGETNQEKLEKELGDLLAMVDIMINQNIVREDQIMEAKIEKYEKLRRWSNIEF